MDNREIIERVLGEADSFKGKSAAELQEMLDKELSKPADKTDYGLVDELTKAIIEAEGKEPLAVDVDKKLAELQAKTAKRRKIFYLPKWAVGVSAACIMLLCANFVSVAAWDMNIISAVIEFTKGGFSVDFDGSEQSFIELPVSEDDPFGIIAECAKYDIYPETPHYLPDGFKLTYTDHNQNSKMTSLTFDFYKENQSISIAYDMFNGESEKIGIPSDNYNLSETTVNGKKAVVSKEDNQYTIIYKDGNIIITIFTQDVSYDECDKIVASIK